MVSYLTGKDIDLSEAAKSVQPKIAVTDVLVGMFTRRYIGRTLLLLLLFVATTPATFLLTVWTTQLLKMLGFSVQETLTAMTIISIGVPAGCFLASLVSDLGGRKLPRALRPGRGLRLIFGAMKSLVLLTLLGFTVTALVMAMGFTLFSYTAESYPTACATPPPASTTAWPGWPCRSQFFIPMIHAAHGFAGIFTTVAMLLFLPVIPLLLWGQRTGGKSGRDRVSISSKAEYDQGAAQPKVNAVSASRRHWRGPARRRRPKPPRSLPRTPCLVKERPKPRKFASCWRGPFSLNTRQHRRPGNTCHAAIDHEM